MLRFTASLAAGFFVGALALQAVAQGESASSAQTPPAHAAPAPASAAYSGCVQQSPTDKDTLVLSAESVCARLTGTLSATQLIGHEIDLKGVLTPRVGTTPASIKVDSVVHVGKSCSDVCALLPPKKRGLGGEVPGKEGGTPGLAPAKPTP
jgi:hypothetical protein